MSQNSHNSCLSDLVLDRALSGELTRDEQRGLTEHLSTCKNCHGRHASLSAAHRSFAQEAIPFSLLAARASTSPARATPQHITTGARVPGEWNAPRVRPRLGVVGVSTLAAAAALVVALNLPRNAPAGGEPTDDTARLKGGATTFSWVVKRGSRMFLRHPDQHLRSGDALRFMVSASEPVYVAIVGFDPSGHANVYYPEGDHLALVQPGRDQLLPSAIELDDAPTEERVYGVFCPHAERIDNVKSAVETANKSPALPGGCTFELRTVTKEPP